MKTKGYLNLRTDLKDESKKLAPEEKIEIINNAEGILNKYTRLFDEAHLKLHIKKPKNKKLIEVRANLKTDNGGYSSDCTGYDVQGVVRECLENLETQLLKRYEMLLEREKAVA